MTANSYNAIKVIIENPPTKEQADARIKKLAAYLERFGIIPEVQANSLFYQMPYGCHMAI